jgi:hypothetical protein
MAAKNQPMKVSLSTAMGYPLLLAVPRVALWQRGIIALR